MTDLSLRRLATLVATPSAKKQRSNHNLHNFGSNQLPESYLWSAIALSDNSLGFNLSRMDVSAFFSQAVAKNNQFWVAY